jgi:tRNA modification GTPase
MERAYVVLVVLEAGRLEAPAGPLPAAAARITVVNKIDLVPGTPAGRHGEAIHVSAKTGAGLDALRQALLEAAGWSARGETVFLARERHLRALHEARERLQAAAAQDARWVFFAEELRLAQQALGTITGHVSADDLLGEIFARFCIGK